MRAELFVRLRFVEIATHVANRPLEIVPERCVDFASRKLRYAFAHLPAKIFLRLFTPRHAHDSEVSWKHVARCEVVKGGHELSPRQISRSAENHDAARISGALVEQSLSQWIQDVVHRGG